MNIETQEVCRLCFKITNFSNSEVPDQILMEKLKKLYSQKFDLGHTEGRTVCCTCVEKANGAFQFKTRCLASENSSMFSKTTANESYSERLDLCRLCRSCLSNKSAVLMLEFLKEINMMEVFQTYMPEIDLEDIQNPLICGPCQTSVTNFCEFMFLLSDVDAQDQENKSINRLIGLNVNSQPVRYFSIMNKDDKEPMKAESNRSYMKDANEICRGSEIDIKKEIKTEAVSDSVEIKTENDDFAFCQQTTMNKESVMNEYNNIIDLKEETESDVHFIDTGVSHNIEFTDFQSKSEELDFKLEPGQIVNTGIGTEEIMAQKRAKCSNNNFELCINSESLYELQIVTHKNPNQVEMFGCHICTFLTTDKRHFQSHMFSHKKFEYQDCTFQTTNKRNHMVSHGSIDETEMHKCHQCPYQTNYGSSFKMHMLVHKNPDEIKMYQCQECSFQTKYKTSLQSHVVIHRNVDEVEMHKCQQCAFQTKYKRNLNKHMVIHRNVDKTEVLKCVDKTEVLKCHQCNYQTNCESSFRKHVLTHKNHDEIKMYQCEECSFQTKYKRSIQCHLIVHKNVDEVEMHKCQQCNFQTKYKKSLSTHMLIHQNVDETDIHNCQLCTYQTIIKSHLRRHMITHKSSVELKMHKCQQCTYETKHKNCFKVHMLIHTKSNEVKRHKCVHCAYQTNYKCNFKIHLLSHVNSYIYKCQQCIFQTRYEDGFKEHMQTHTEIYDSYKCQQCTFQIMDKESFNLHMLSHENSTKFKTINHQQGTFQTNFESFLKNCS